MANFTLSWQGLQGGNLPLTSVGNPPSVSWISADPNNYFTLIVYSLDHPHSPYVNFLAVNIPGSLLQDSDIVFPYERLSGIGTIRIDLFLQTSLVDPLDPVIQSRANFDLVGFISRYGVVNVANMFVNVISHSTIPSSTIVIPRFPRSSRSPRLSSPIRDNGENIIRVDSTLSEQQQKYCRCVLKVAAKQPAECDLSKGRTGNCSNSYAICSSSTHGSNKQCGENYNFEGMDDIYLKAYAELSRVPIPSPYDRQTMINNIYSWKAAKYGSSPSRSR